MLLACMPPHVRPTPQTCQTRCGLRSPAGCPALQALEDRAVRAFGRLDWGGPEAVCAALQGWRIRVHPRRESDDIACSPRAWVLSAGLCALGYTHVESREVELPDTDFESNVIAHELVHVLDLTIHGHAGHCEWYSRGIKTALLEIQGLEDTSEAESSCAEQ